MNQVFVGDLSFVWGSMFFLLVKFDLAHMVSINTSVFYGENPANSSYFEGRKILKRLNFMRWPRL
jgi:hypothetical protein